MGVENGIFLILKVAANGVDRGGECDVLIGNFFWTKEVGLQGFLADSPLGAVHAGQKKAVDLIDSGNAVKAMDPDDLYVYPGLFQGLTAGPFFYTFTIFQITCRKVPEADPGLYGSLAKEDSVFKKRQTADDHLGIAVMDGTTIGTNVAGTVVAFWYFQL